MKVGEEEYSLFRDHEYVFSNRQDNGMLISSRLLAKINE